MDREIMKGQINIYVVVTTDRSKAVLLLFF